MAESVVTVTVKQTWFDGKMLHVLGTLAIGASPGTYSTGGIAFPLKDPLIKAQRAPQKVSVSGIAGYQYAYVAGTDNTNGKLKILASTTETSSGAMPAGISGDTIQFEAMFLGQN